MQEEQVGLSDLLEAGVHFGHQTRRWNPKMKKFIFTERNGIHIIDLRKTLDRLMAAKEAVRQVVLAGEKVLFVCTKRQLRSIIEQEAGQCGAFYVTERWLGGADSRSWSEGRKRAPSSSTRRRNVFFWTASG
jgi:small subunit ribosomal protein S2